MNIVKKALAITAIVLASFSVSATLIGGVQWDPNHPVDFKGVASSIYQEVSLTGVLSGYGRITSFNEGTTDDLCPGCELTFHFGGFTPSVVDAAVSDDFEYSGGWMKLWVDYSIEVVNPNAISSMTFGTTGDDGGANALWLDLEGHEYIGTETTFIGTVFENLLQGAGFFDVVGGLAMGSLNTNTIVTTGSPVVGNADFSFTSSFTDFPSETSSTGTANFKGKSIPEPSTLAIFALGLIALAMRAHNKRI